MCVVYADTEVDRPELWSHERRHSDLCAIMGFENLCSRYADESTTVGRCGSSSMRPDGNQVSIRIARCESGRARPGWRSAGLLVLLASLAAACDPYIGLPSQAIGLSETPDGDVVVRYVYCPDESLKRVQLFLGAEDDPVVGDRGDRLLWEILAQKGEQPRPTDFVLGEVPDGFEQTVELHTTLVSGRLYGILIDSTIQVIGSAEFTVDQVRTDRILSTERYFTEAEFRDRGAEKCDVPEADG